MNSVCISCELVSLIGESPPIGWIYRRAPEFGQDELWCPKCAAVKLLDNPEKPEKFHVLVDQEVYLLEVPLGWEASFHCNSDLPMIKGSGLTQEKAISHLMDVLHGRAKSSDHIGSGMRNRRNDPHAVDCCSGSMEPVQG